MIKHVLVAAAVTLPAVGARAADLPLARKAPAMSSSLFTWTGFYGGINAGFKFSGDDDVHTEGQAAPNIANIEGGAHSIEMASLVAARSVTITRLDRSSPASKRILIAPTSATKGRLPRRSS